jgi:hypothetical protein
MTSTTADQEVAWFRTPEPHYGSVIFVAKVGRANGMRRAV